MKSATPAARIPSLWRNNEAQLLDEIILRYHRHCRAFAWSWHAREGTLRYKRACEIMRHHAAWLNSLAEFLYAEIPHHCADAIVEELADRGCLHAVPEKLWPQAYREAQQKESFLMKLATVAEELPMLV